MTSKKKGVGGGKGGWKIDFLVRIIFYFFYQDDSQITFKTTNNKN